MIENKRLLKSVNLMRKSIGDTDASICFIYSQYSKKYESKNPEVLKYATDSFNSYIKLYRKNPKTLEEGFNELGLTREDYSSLTLLLLDKNDFNYDVESNQSICELVDKLLDIKANDIVFDLGSGHGCFLGYVAKMEKDKFIRPVLIGQEINPHLVYLSKMLLEMCDANFYIENVNSISKRECSNFTKGYIFPPFGLKYDETIYDSFVRQSPELFNGRVSSPWLFLFSVLPSLKGNGRIVMIVSESSLFQSADANIRKYLIDNELIEGIISLPLNAFDGLSIKMDILVLSNGNKSFKVVDGIEVLKDLPVKGLMSHEAAIDLYNAYNDPKAKKFTKEDMKTVDCCLSLNSLSGNNLYDGLTDLANLTDVVDILKGSPLTLANFSSVITERETGTKILTSSNIDDNGIIDYDSLKNVVEDKNLEKYIAKEGDIIMTSKSTKVKLAIVDKEIKDKIIITGGMIILRPKVDKIDSTFLKIFFDSGKGREILSSIQKGSVITTISIANLATLKVPCPDIKYQKDMSSRYKTTLSEYRKVKKELLRIESNLNNFYEGYKENK